MTDLGNFKPTGRQHALFLALIMAVVFALYAGTVHFPVSSWDDPFYLYANPWIRTLSWENLKESFTQPYFSLYIPLTLLSYTLDFQHLGYHPFHYHLTNVLLHLANVILVYGLLVLMTGEWALAFGVTLLFGIHPVQVESVAWIAERKNLLSSFFFLLALGTYLLSSVRAEKRRFFYGATLLFFLAACLSKPSVIVFPLLILAYDFCHGRLNKERFAGHLPFWFLAVLFGVVTCLIVRGEDIMQYHGGSFAATLRAMAVAMMKYFELLFYPVGLNLLYEFPEYKSFLERPVLLSLAGLAALAAALLFLWKKDRKLFFWAAWYGILLLPLMNFIPFPSLMNDRYLYLPMIGIFALLAALLKIWAGEVPVLAISCVAAAALIPINLDRQSLWLKPEHVYVETRWGRPQSVWEYLRERSAREAVSPALAGAREELFSERDVGAAIRKFGEEAERSGDPLAYEGLGIAHFEKGDHEKAIEYFKKAIEANPDVASFHGNLGLAYVHTKQLGPAWEEFRKAVALDPKEVIYHNNLASLLDGMGRIGEAEKEFLAAYEADPDFAGTLFNLGYFYNRERKFEEARKYWSRLIDLYPDHEAASYVRSKLAKMGDTPRQPADNPQ